MEAQSGDYCSTAGIKFAQGDEDKLRDFFQVSHMTLQLPHGAMEVVAGQRHQDITHNSSVTS